MIVEFKTDKKPKYECEYCKYNCGYLLQDKNIIDCKKKHKLVNQKEVQCKREV